MYIANEFLVLLGLAAIKKFPAGARQELHGYETWWYPDCDGGF